MSPRRKVEPDSKDIFCMPEPQRRRWVLPLVAGVAAVVVLAAVAVSALMLVERESERRDLFRDAAVLQTVSGFMTQYTSPDPFHANDYANKILAQGTGQFAKLYQDKMNEIVIQVAQAEPTKGAVQAVGIERWNPDGSANVVVATTTTTKMPDGKTVASGSRWVVTTIKEGEQWKISNLLQVI
jgi:Mce-associated membrane protein